MTIHRTSRLNEHQQKLNDKQRIEQNVQRRIACIQARVIRRYNTATSGWHQSQQWGQRSP